MNAANVDSLLPDSPFSMKHTGGAGGGGLTLSSRCGFCDRNNYLGKGLSLSSKCLRRCLLKNIFLHPLARDTQNTNKPVSMQLL